MLASSGPRMIDGRAGTLPEPYQQQQSAPFSFCWLLICQLAVCVVVGHGHLSVDDVWIWTCNNNTRRELSGRGCQAKVWRSVELLTERGL